MSDLPEPVTREEMFLSAVAGESATLPAPVTREELFLAKAAGENVITPEPVTRREMFLDAIAAGGGGGGGNPNYIETIEGTLENPWGNNNPENLFDEVSLNNATIILTYDDGNYVFSIEDLAFVYANVRSNGVTAAVEIKYKESGAFQKANDESGPIDPTTPCTLTIIHHPMPTSEG